MPGRSSGVKPRLNQQAACSSSFSWMFNDQEDDPCKIASVLLGQCTSDGAWDVPNILPNATYSPPSSSEANACQCNTVSYSLLCACATCQGGFFQSFANWTVNCPSNVVARQSFPNRTALTIDVPPWAYSPLTSSGFFDIMHAGQPNPMVSSIITFSTPAPSTSVASTASPATPPTPSAKSLQQVRSQNNIEIAIAVIVTLILVATLIAGFLFFKSRRQRASNHNQKRGVYQPLFTHPNRQLSMSSVESDTVVDIAPARRTTFRPAHPSFLTGFFTNLRRASPAISPYTPDQVQPLASPPVKVFMTDMAVHPSMSPSTPSSTASYNFNNRPRLDRVLTDPLPRPIRTRPLSRASTIPPQSTIPEPSTSPMGSSQQHSAIAEVVNVPRPLEWHIEDTPTTAVDSPMRQAYVGDTKKPRSTFETMIQGSVRSISPDGGFDGSWQDSDSMAPLSPSALDDVRLRDSAETHGIDSSLSTAGSSVEPMSAATASSRTVPDAVRYGDPQSRTQLFPASVRAAGYTGIPRKDSRPQLAQHRTISAPFT